MPKYIAPPYLFNDNGTLAIRPTIQAPESADYNSTISVTGSPEIKSFSLVRFSSATHSTNNEQRRIPVGFVERSGGYDISIPDRNLLPPGYYMLFGLDKFDVPSIAENIQIGNNIPFEGTDDCNIISRINGVFDVSATITVNEGDDVMVFMLTNGADFVITLPDGSEVNDSHAMDSITPEEAGIYTFTTTKNCSKTLNIIVVPVVSNDLLIINGVGGFVDSYTPGVQDNGTFAIENNGTTLKMMGNAWKKAPFNGTITVNTVMNFEFRVTGTGEVHGIGFDNDNWLGGSLRQLFFQLAGTQTYAIQDYRTYTGNDWQTISIPIGEHFTGDFNYLIFSADKDRNASAQESYFRNITFSEDGPQLDAHHLKSAVETPAASATKIEVDDIIVSPNPSKGVLGLYLGKMMNVSAKVSIYNAVGREIYSVSYNRDHQDAETMDLSFLANGVYRIIVEADNNTYHKSVVIQK